MSHMKEIRVTLEGDDLTLVEAESGVSASEFVNRAVTAAIDALRPESPIEEPEDEDESGEDPGPMKSGKPEAGDSKPAADAPGKKTAEG